MTRSYLPACGKSWYKMVGLLLLLVLFGGQACSSTSRIAGQAGGGAGEAGAGGAGGASGAPPTAGDGGSPNEGGQGGGPQTFVVGGVVVGLTSGEVSLALNQEETLSVSENDSFTFETELADGAEYSVEVEAQPPDQLCLVERGAGMIDGADVSNVVVQCAIDVALLADLSVSDGTLTPGFAADELEYTVDVELETSSITITPTAQDRSATITVQGAEVASGAPSSAIPLRIGENPITVVVTAPSDQSFEYHVNARRAAELTTEVYFKPTIGSETLGRTLAFAGDTLLFGAPMQTWEEFGMLYSEAGVVHTFVRGAMGWREGGRMFGQISEAGLGSALAISSDELTAAVAEDTTEEFVHLYSRSGNNWTFERTVETPQANIDFGASLAVDAGYLAVGAPFFGDLADGAVFIYRHNGSAWPATPTDTLDFAPYGNSLSGGAVALSNSILVIGAWGIAGQWAWVYELETGNWVERQRVFPDVAGDVGFGRAVATDGDTIVVGAPNASVGFASAGAAYVYVQNGDTWEHQQTLTASNAAANRSFGASVAVSGDWLVVGDPSEASNAKNLGGDQVNSDAADAGAAYLFTRTNGIWTQQAYVKASNSDAGDGFGTSVGVSGTTIAFGAPGEDSNAIAIDGDRTNNSATDSGAGYVRSLR